MNDREQQIMLGSHYELIRGHGIYKDALRKIALQDPTREWAGEIARAALDLGASAMTESRAEQEARLNTKLVEHLMAPVILERDYLKALNAELVASLSECLPWAQEYADEWNDNYRVPMPSKQLARLERARAILAKVRP